MSSEALSATDLNAEVWSRIDLDGNGIIGAKSTLFLRPVVPTIPTQVPASTATAPPLPTTPHKVCFFPFVLLTPQAMILVLDP